MIKSINLIHDNKTHSCGYKRLHEHEFEIDSEKFQQKSITLVIEFERIIVNFRNHDYKWVALNSDRLANWFSPKLIKLDNGQLVQANQMTGIWEVEKEHPTILRWHINPDNAYPITDYDSNNHKKIIQASPFQSLAKPLGLLFPNNFGIEVSRSKIPFSAICCFTDHCDFDSLDSLIHQRNFFKKHQIKVTKGFFLRDYSKRNDTACSDHHAEELRKWLDDGHELAYHSLSQSIKPLDNALEDFKSFEPPFADIKTWIDHGFQPYNLTQFKNHQQINSDYGQVLRAKNIHNLWNYIDTGTAVNGVINQINPQQFTLGSYYNGIKHLGSQIAIPLMIKNIVFHASNSQQTLKLYRDIANYMKNLNRKRSFKKHFKLLSDMVKLAGVLMPILFLWKTRKRTVYPMAKYSSVCFDHQISGEKFEIFQTLEMIDFKLGLCKNNIDLLVEEHGLFIAHTYFSAPMNYHKGKLFNNENQIDAQVEENFAYLSQKIKKGDIWNPTVDEITNYFKLLKPITFECAEDGELTSNDMNQNHFREVR